MASANASLSSASSTVSFSADEGERENVFNNDRQKTSSNLSDMSRVAIREPCGSRKSTESLSSSIGNFAAPESLDEDLGNKMKEQLAKDNDVQQGVEKSFSSVVATHYNNLEEKGLIARNQSRILYMRNFNNWIKSYLINKYINELCKVMQNHEISVIDLGCGKGGDLLKWTKANIGHLVCVDIAETSVIQCRERYDFSRGKKFSGPPYSAEFIVADCTKPLLKDPGLSVHMVSCQFAFHYCFESLSQAETMIKNVTSNLASGGFFLLTIPDSYYIMKQLEIAKSRSFGNAVFHIEFPEDRPEPPPLFGDRYQFYLEGVVDCPEFLVHQPTLYRLCKKYGLKCIYKRRFPDVFQDARINPEMKNLLHRMLALERYPKADGQVSDSNEYSAAREFLKNNERRSVLTLSSSEWEAVSIYTALAFKKC